MKREVAIGPDVSLDLEQVARVARSLEPRQGSLPRAKVSLTSQARQRMEESSDWVESIVSALDPSSPSQPQAYYGINTGFGALAGRTALNSGYLTRVLTRNLIASHSAGVREYFDEETVRAAILLRAHSLAQGYSGVREVVVEKLVTMLNHEVYPAIPSMGSLGASGDLAPLSHLALLISSVPRPPFQGEDLDLDASSGEGFLPVASSDTADSKDDPFFHTTHSRPTGRQRLWRRVTGAEAMLPAGGGIELRAKEGLALNNGTTFSAALASLSLFDALNLLENADVALAMTLESLRGFRDPFFAEVHEVRGHLGAQSCAARVLRYSRDSNLLDGSRKEPPQRIPPQDPYSIRCAPQVHGAVRDTLAFIRSTVETELNAATDNPLIFLDLDRSYKTVSGGNFHGAPLAYAMDFLSIALTDLGSICERRIFKLTDYHVDKPFGLPPFILSDPEITGLNSGLMIAQYTAASLVSECKTLAHPDSVDSITSSAGQEDHVSMSLNAALHARRIVDNVEFVVAIELLCAAQALDWRKRNGSSVQLGKGVEAVLESIRSRIPYLDRDRALYPDIRQALAMVRSGELLAVAEDASLQPNRV